MVIKTPNLLSKCESSSC